jgi:glycosyltransferase involved in cell wall biosynthesis
MSFQQLKRSGEDVQCLWIAPGPPDRALSRALEQSGLNSSFALRTQAGVGGTPSAYLGAVARLCDLFVLPSLLEGLPLALVEAMALGKACLATRINAVPELIRHNVTGWLVPPADATSLAAAISKLVADEALRTRLGAAALADLSARYEGAVALCATRRFVRAPIRWATV